MTQKLEIPGEIVKADAEMAQVETIGKSIKKQCRCNALKYYRCRITKAQTIPDPTEYAFRTGEFPQALILSF